MDQVTAEKERTWRTGKKGGFDMVFTVMTGQESMALCD